MPRGVPPAVRATTTVQTRDDLAGRAAHRQVPRPPDDHTAPYVPIPSAGPWQRSSDGREGRALTTTLETEVVTSLPAAEPRRRNEVLRFFGELPLLIAAALGIALLIKAFLVQPFYIEQESMLPTLHPSERVLVSKLNYRFGDPQRGDIVIFRNPQDPCERNPSLPNCDPSALRRAFDWVVQTFGLPTPTSDDLVKRIVALPGDTLEMRDGQLYVCTTPGCDPLSADGRPKDGLLVKFAITEEEGPRLDKDNIEQTTVAEDQYYVLGDNRDSSVDSRTFGTVKRTEFVGKVVALIWPPTRWQGL